MRRLLFIYNTYKFSKNFEYNILYILTIYTFSPNFNRFRCISGLCTLTRSPDPTARHSTAQEPTRSSKRPALSIYPSYIHFIAKIECIPDDSRQNRDHILKVQKILHKKGRRLFSLKTLRSASKLRLAVIKDAYMNGKSIFFDFVSFMVDFPSYT